MTIFAATGHRPDKLGGYSPYAERLLYEYALLVLRPYAREGFKLSQHKVISGMALGWDTAWAKAALMHGIPLIVAVPFVGQEQKWPDDSRAQYTRILNQAENVVCVSPGGYAVEKMQKRNEWMVDNCQKLVALWNGTPGGTANCVRYAREQDVPWVNVWDGWVSRQAMPL